MIKYNYEFDAEEDKARDHLVQKDEKPSGKEKEEKKSKKPGTDEVKPQTQETD